MISQAVSTFGLIFVVMVAAVTGGFFLSIILWAIAVMLEKKR